MFGGVKITLILCLTILATSVLFISYNEYKDRYSIIPSSDNSLYIFDKKNTILNKCDDKGCVMIDTKLPKSGLNPTESDTSKLFDGVKTMVSKIKSPDVSKVEATDSSKAGEKSDVTETHETDEEKTVPEKDSKNEDDSSKESSEKHSSDKSDKKEESDENITEEDEFVE